MELLGARLNLRLKLPVVFEFDGSIHVTRMKSYISNFKKHFIRSKFSLESDQFDLFLSIFEMVIIP